MPYKKNINKNERRLRELAGAIKSSKPEHIQVLKTEGHPETKEVVTNDVDVPNIKPDIIKVLVVAAAILSLQICISLTSF